MMSQAIAVIGSGMAGLAAARVCRDAGHQVTVFEAQGRQGMDAHSLALHGGLVDVPLRVMSPLAWRSVLALATHVGVQTFPVDTHVSCSWLDRHSWFRMARLPLTGWAVPASWRYLDRSALRLGWGFVQLTRVLDRLSRSPDAGLTLGDVVAREAIDPLFWRGLLLPMLTTICTCSEAHLLAWPARDLLGLVQVIVHGDTLVRLRGGTPALAQALARDLTFISGSPVVRVVDTGIGVDVANQRGEVGQFDRVIVAAPANQLDFLDREHHARELAVLDAMRFDRGELVVHADPRFMPGRRKDWTALNYLMDRDLTQSMFTVWVNAVEPSLADAPPVFQTWNPLFDPEPTLTVARIPMARAVVHEGTAAAQHALAALHAEPGRRLFFCGSWAYPGVPLLESAVRSAVAVGRHVSAPAAWCPA